MSDLTETTAVDLLTKATIQAAIQISIDQGFNNQKNFVENLISALKTTVGDNMGQVTKEWKEATEAGLNNAWLQELMKTQAVELAQMAVTMASTN